MARLCPEAGPTLRAMSAERTRSTPVDGGQVVERWEELPGGAYRHTTEYQPDSDELDRQDAETELQALLGVPGGTEGVRLPEG
jgi:hypothetical protein